MKTEKIEFLNPPSLLIGHSLGGAAVLHASKEIESVQAVATIGAPSEPVHVKKLLSENIEEINKKALLRYN